jgi:hypothetical protein
MTLRKIMTVGSILIAMCFLAGSAMAETKIKTAPGARSGLIQMHRHIYYLDAASPTVMEVAVVFPKSLDPVWTGEADAWLVIWVPNAEEVLSYLVKAQLTGEGTTLAAGWVPDQPRNLLTIDWKDLSTLPAGDYQMGLILTKQGGDPADLAQWYGGFSGLVSVTRLKITTGLDEEDQDGDGEPDEGTQDGFPGVPM